MTILLLLLLLYSIILIFVFVTIANMQQLAYPFITYTPIKIVILSLSV